MDIIACIKRVPDTTGADRIAIDASGRDIERRLVAFKINDWDEYVLEAGVQLKEGLGGSLTALTVGSQEWEDILRRALAMGADAAVRVDEDVVDADPRTVAAILSSAIGRLSYDLVLFGAQSEDFGCGQLGVMVAEMLGIPHAALVVDIQAEDGWAKVSRELEAGLLETYRMRLPALLTVQTGINRPRYISLGGIRRAMRRELQVTSLGELGLSGEALAPVVRLERMELPPKGKEAVLISGSPEEAADHLTRILQDSGVL